MPLGARSSRSTLVVHTLKAACVAFVFFCFQIEDQLECMELMNLSQSVVHEATETLRGQVEQLRRQLKEREVAMEAIEERAAAQVKE